MSETTDEISQGSIVHDRQGTALKVLEVRGDGRFLVGPASDPPPGLGGPQTRVVKHGELLAVELRDDSGEPENEADDGHNVEHAPEPEKAFAPQIPAEAATDVEWPEPDGERAVADVQDATDELLAEQDDSEGGGDGEWDGSGFEPIDDDD